MYRLKQFTLALLDFALLYAGLYLALLVRSLGNIERPLAPLYAPMLVLFLAALPINFIVGLYDLGRTRTNRLFFRRVATAASVWTVIGIIFFYVNSAVRVAPKTILALTALFGFGLITLWRIFYNQYLARLIWQTRVVFAGLNEAVVELAPYIVAQPELGYSVAGLIINADANLPEALKKIPRFASLANFGQKKFDLIVLSPTEINNRQLFKDLYAELFRQVSVVELADFYENILGRVPPFTFSEGWFLTHLKEQSKKIYDRARLIIDLLIALLTALVFFSTLPIIAVLIKITSRGPVFFKQTRLGKLEAPFTMFKYRTMRVLASDGSAELAGPQFAALHDPRVTALGKVLRKSRLDELPQCLNVLRGEMALIGPRPERPEFVRQLTAEMPFYSLRHLIKPGLTGWAQIHRSYYGDIAENLHKLQYDLYYIKNRGPLLDLVIVLKTFNILARLAGR